MQRSGQQIKAARGCHAIGGDVKAREEMCRRVDDRGEHNGGADARFSLERGKHRASQEGLLDERHRNAAQKARRKQLGEGGCTEAAVGPPEEAERRHDCDDGEHGDRAYRERQQHLMHETPPGQRVPEALLVGETGAFGHEHESDQQRQHTDALAQAVKWKIEMRMQQQPSRIGEHRNRRQSGDHESDKQQKCPHSDPPSLSTWSLTEKAVSDKRQ